MRVELTTHLDAPADTIWDALQKSESLRYVASPLAGFRAEFPRRWRDGGGVVRIERVMLFRVLPAWSHEIRFVRIDDDEREIFTNERGGPIELWNHLIWVEPVSGRRCRYTDAVEIRAGKLTFLVWLYAQLFYRYRQARWRGLARVLG